MKGIKIFHSNILVENHDGLIGYIHNRLNEEKGSDFFVYFEKLLSLLDDHYWIIDQKSLYLPWYIDDNDLKEEPELIEYMDYCQNYLTEYKPSYCDYVWYRVYENSIIKKYASYVRDDWNRLICFSGELAKIEEVLESKRYKSNIELLQYLEDNIDFYFHNTDGISWEVFASDERYLDIIKEDLVKYSNVNIKDYNLVDHLELLDYL